MFSEIVPHRVREGRKSTPVEKLRKIQSSSDISCSLCVQALGRWIEFPYKSR